MRLSRVVAISAVALAASGCSKPPTETPTDGGTAEHAELVPFRTEVGLVRPQPIPDGARLNVYVVESNLEAGTRRVIGEYSETSALIFPVHTQVSVPKSALHPERGYEVIATVVDVDGKVILDATGYRPPMPGIGLSRESTYLVMLGPVVTPAPPELVFRLPRPLVLMCDSVELNARQVEGGDVVLTSPDGEIRLPPAVATSGGRFSDGSTELWVTKRLEAFVIFRGREPMPCSVG